MDVAEEGLRRLAERAHEQGLDHLVSVEVQDLTAYPYPANTFVVLNRWGNVVYDRLNYTNDWRGENTAGEQLPNGTYFIILNVNDGERVLQGYVDLRR